MTEYIVSGIVPGGKLQHNQIKLGFINVWPKIYISPTNA